MSDDLVTLVSTELSADVSPLGAELIRLDDAVGDPLLWNGDPAVWSGRAPLLFPIVGELAGGVFRHRGRSYALPRHGFARRSTFALLDRGSAHATFRLEANDATRALWPFEFRLDVTHALDGAKLTTTATVTNLSDEPMPTGFGFHPAFRWPLAGAGPRAAHVVHFEEPEPAPIRRLDAAGLLDPTPRPTPVVGDMLALDDALFSDDVVIFDRLDSRRLTYGAGHVRLAVAFEGMPHFGLWTKPGAPFVCLEPWQGHADPAGYAGELAEKPGQIALLPGEIGRFAMSVALEFATP
ncbi:MAG: aldose 1-epimerase family protein [Hyphomicrobiales bacterium]|nr:aldose 1-epimerase family protein [Hyphomicrobiales bacterium]